MSSKEQFFDYEPLRRSPRNPLSQEDRGEDGLTGKRAKSRPSAPSRTEWKSPPLSRQSDAQTLSSASSPDEHPTREKFWSLKRGHALTYAFLFLFTLVLYFRPYELFSALSSLTSLAYWLAIITLAIYVFSQFATEGSLTALPTEAKLILLLCLTGLFSIPLAASPAYAWETFNDVFFKAVLMFIVMINVVRTERRLRGLIFLALAVSLMLSLGALNDYRIGHFTVEGYRISGMIGGLFGNPNDLALHLVTITPIAFALALSSRSFIKKIAYGSCCILMIAANIVTFSRGGFLGLIGLVAFFGWKFGRRKNFSVILLLFLGMILLFAFMPGGYGDRMGTMFTGGDALGSYGARRELLKKSIMTALYNPFFGIGMGNFDIVSAHNKVSHNAFTQVAAEMGLMAFFSYLMFMIVPFWRLGRIERETYGAPGGKHKFYYLSLGLQASLVGYMISSFFASVAYQWYVYYLVAYAVCLRRLYETGSPAAKEDNRAVVPAAAAAAV